jgi:hypothetical protein
MILMMMTMRFKITQFVPGETYKAIKLFSFWPSGSAKRKNIFPDDILIIVDVRFDDNKITFLHEKHGILEGWGNNDVHWIFWSDHLEIVNCN